MIGLPLYAGHTAMVEELIIHCLHSHCFYLGLVFRFLSSGSANVFVCYGIFFHALRSPWTCYCCGIVFFFYVGAALVFWEFIRFPTACVVCAGVFRRLSSLAACGVLWQLVLLFIRFIGFWNGFVPLFFSTGLIIYSYNWRSYSYLSFVWKLFQRSCYRFRWRPIEWASC